MSDELPEGWAPATLGALVVHALGGDWGKAATERELGAKPVGVVRGTEFRQWNTARAATAAVRYLKPQSLERRRLAEGDLVIEMSGGGPNQAVGRVLRIDADALRSSPLPLVCSNFCRQLRLTQNVESGFVELALKNAYARGELEPLQTQTTNLRNLNFDGLLGLDVPLPPLVEQKRIVARVETLLADVNRARDCLAKIPTILTRFRQSVLAAACSGKLTGSRSDRGDPTDASWVPLADLVVSGGIFDGARDHGSATRVELNLRTADYTSSGVRVVRLENLGHLSFNDDKRTYISPTKFASLKQSAVFPGDVLFSSFIGDPMRVCVMPTLEDPALAKADCFCVRPNQEQILPTYLAMQLACRRTYDSIVGEIHGATRARITTRQLAAIRIPICSLGEQAATVAKAAALFALADVVDDRAASGLAAVQAAPHAILSKAFAGELVPIEAELARLERRDYEPASALLSRLTSNGRTAAAPHRRRSANGKTVSKSAR